MTTVLMVKNDQAIYVDSTNVTAHEVLGWQRAEILYGEREIQLPVSAVDADKPGTGKFVLYAKSGGLYTRDENGDVVGPLAPADPMAVVEIAADDAITLALAPACHVVTLSEACAVTFPTPEQDYHIMDVVLIENATGGYAVTWPATVEWDSGTEPTQTTTAANKSTWSFRTYDGGTSWLGIRLADGIE